MQKKLRELPNLNRVARNFYRVPLIKDPSASVSLAMSIAFRYEKKYAVVPDCLIAELFFALLRSMQAGLLRSSPLRVFSKAHFGLLQLNTAVISNS